MTVKCGHSRPLQNLGSGSSEGLANVVTMDTKRVNRTAFIIYKKTAPDYVTVSCNESRTHDDMKCS